MPTSEAGFLNHPLYCLASQLHQNQIIQGLDEEAVEGGGKQTGGKQTGGKQKGKQTKRGKQKKRGQRKESAAVVGRFKHRPVYRRSAVRTVQSAAQWKKVCRQVKDDELDHPAKVLPPSEAAKSAAAEARRIHRRMNNMEGAEEEGGEPGNNEADETGENATNATNATNDASSDDEDEATRLQDGTPLYGEWQTVHWVPPPVVNGTLPRNDHGNWEVWTEGHIPKGASHLPKQRSRHVKQLWMKAAKHLKIDYVQVVMGFKREGGNTVPNFNGILVADRFVDSVVQTGEGLEALAAQEAARKRRQKVLLRWSTLVRQLQTKSHVANQFGGGGGGGKSGSSSSSADVQVERM